MYMQMKHRLSGLGPHIQDRAITLLDSELARDLSRRQVTAPDNFGFLSTSFFQSANMLLGHDQDMGRCFRVNVFEGKRMLIFVDFFRRNLAGNNLAEKTIAHSANPISPEKSRLHPFWRHG